MKNTYFLTRIRYTANTWDKGVEVYTDIDEAKGAMHAFMGNFGYGRHESTTFCTAYITDVYNKGNVAEDKWIKQEQA